MQHKLLISPYPFGSPMPTRTWSDPNTKYKYGFNGKEKDNEINVDGGDYDYGARIYDSRLGRFLIIDPFMKYYPWYSPFHFAGNTPIQAIDLDGLEEYKVVLYTSNNRTCAKITLINASGDLKINYVSSNMRPAQGTDPVPTAYQETAVKTSTCWETTEEQMAGTRLKENQLTDVFFIDPNNHLLDPVTSTPVEPIPISTTPSTSTTPGANPAAQPGQLFQGQKLDVGTTVTINGVIPFYCNQAPTGNGNSPGDMSDDGKQIFTELAKKLIKLKTAKSVNISLTLSTINKDLSYFNNVTAPNIQLNLNKLLKDNGVKIKINITVVAGEDQTNGAKIEVR